MGSEQMHVLQGEPLGTACRLGCPLRKMGIGFEDASKMRGGHGDQIPRDLPSGELSQSLAPVFCVAAAHKILATRGAEIGRLCEAVCGDRISQRPGGLCG